MTTSLNITALQTKLTLSLKDLYPIALEADEVLEKLQGEQKGQFSAIFLADSEYSVQANRFLPYLIELNDEIQSLPVMSPDNQVNKIQPDYHLT